MSHAAAGAFVACFIVIAGIGYETALWLGSPWQRAD